MHQATPETVSLLQAHGWTVECEHPLEIRHDETGSVATMLGAHAVVAELLSEMEAELSPAPVARPSQAQSFAELEQIVQRSQRLVDVASGFGHEDGESAQASEAWQTAYDLVFSSEISHRAAEMCAVLNRKFDYYDPDLGYEEDVQAYHRALTAHVAKLKPFFSEAT